MPPAISFLNRFSILDNKLKSNFQNFTNVPQRHQQITRRQRSVPEHRPLRIGQRPQHQHCLRQGCRYPTRQRHARSSRFRRQANSRCDHEHLQNFSASLHDHGKIYHRATGFHLKGRDRSSSSYGHDQGHSICSKIRKCFNVRRSQCRHAKIFDSIFSVILHGIDWTAGSHQQAATSPSLIQSARGCHAGHYY